MMLFVAQHHHSLPFFVSNHVGHQEGRSEIRRYNIIFLHPHRVRYLKTQCPCWSRCKDARCPGCHPDRVTSPDIMILILPDRRGDHGRVPNWFYHSHIYHHYALHITHSPAFTDDYSSEKYEYRQNKWHVLPPRKQSFQNFN